MRTKALPILILAAVVSLSEAAPQSPPAAKPAGPAPRLADGKPDLTGVWTPAGGGGDGLAELEKLYTPAARAKMKGLGEPDDPLYRCLPYGVPRAVVSSPWPFQIVQRAGMMVVLTEYYHAFRLIPTDGSPHPVDVLPSYFGDSTGRWEGDTLVVDIVGFNGKTWLADARDRPTPTSNGVWLHSDAMRVVERWRMIDADTIEYQAVVEDPQMLSAPWTTPRKTLRRQPFKKIGEGMCFDTTTYDLTQGLK
jgi:hypothetical protein